MQKNSNSCPKCKFLPNKIELKTSNLKKKNPNQKFNRITLNLNLNCEYFYYVLHFIDSILTTDFRVRLLSENNTS